MKKVIEILTAMYVEFDMHQSDVTFADGALDTLDPPALVVRRGRAGVAS